MSGRPGGGAMNVFDRAMKRQQKKWAASLHDTDKYDYLRAEVMMREKIDIWLIMHGTIWYYVNFN